MEKRLDLELIALALRLHCYPLAGDPGQIAVPLVKLGDKLNI